MLISLLLILGSNSLFAQPGRNWNAQPPDSVAAKTTKIMADSLNLSSAQVSRIESVNLLFANKMAETRKGNVGDREGMRSAMQQLRIEQNEQLEKYLTTDQFNKWLRIQEYRRQNRRSGQSDKIRKRNPKS